VFSSPLQILHIFVLALIAVVNMFVTSRFSRLLLLVPLWLSVIYKVLQSIFLMP